MKLSKRMDKIPAGQKIVFVPSTIQARISGIIALELYPDKTCIKVYGNGAKVKSVLTEDQLDMTDNDFNIFKFT